jgi:Cu+-exporting ATPase
MVMTSPSPAQPKGEPAPAEEAVKKAPIEPDPAAADAGPKLELADMRRRFWIGLALTLPVVLEAGGHLFRTGLDPRLSPWIGLGFATPVVLWAGWPLLVRGYRSVVSRSLDMFTLVALSIGTAYIYSAFAVLAPEQFQAALRDMGGTVPVFFGAAAGITVLVLLGQVLELRARAQILDAIRPLTDLAPKTARRMKGKTEEEVALEAVTVNDRLRVRPGERVPVDGVLIEGRSTIDESMVTGQSLPVSKEAGAKVIAGTINRGGSFVMRAERVGRDTLISRIVRTVAQAQHSRAPIQRLADQVCTWLVPLVIAVALAAFAVWFQFGPQPRFAHGLVAAVSVLIIACPCAFGLSTRLPLLVGISCGAGQGVLMRSVEALERLEKVDTLVIDKTGTLTEGRPRVTSIAPAAGYDAIEVLRLAASVEHASEHPLARAVAEAAAQRKLRLVTVHGFDPAGGRGVVGLSERRRIVLGNARFLAELNIPLALAAEAERLRAEGATAIFLAVDGKVAGLIAVSDAVKVTTVDALVALRQDGWRIVMMTGDDRTSALAVARRVGITEVDAEILKEGKAAAVERLRSEGRLVAVAGDGINDASALAAADVGIAIGNGTDVAPESAGIALLKRDVTGIVRANRLSKAVMRNIRQNLSFAFVYNAAGVPIAAGVLYPIVGFQLPPVLAAATMLLASVSVIGNALWLRRGLVRITGYGAAGTARRGQ